MSLGKAVLFELARVADRTRRIGNKTLNPNDEVSTSINRGDFNSLGDITLNFFGRDESNKVVRIIYQNY